ncbi:YybH family protein [Isoptericola sp. NPDC058082]|uniref:YybH family protein n=1 Tax=Isoptericola sp. NPDC058082 TaxID=3346331 RepID=UPI0036E9234A
MVNDEHVPALEPDDLGRLFVERLNAGDLEGLVALYEPDAVFAFPPGEQQVGREAIRAALGLILAARPQLAPGVPARALVQGDLALTSTRLESGAVTAEVARRQADGTWRWVLDQPAVA